MSEQESRSGPTRGRQRRQAAPTAADVVASGQAMTQAQLAAVRPAARAFGALAADAREQLLALAGPVHELAGRAPGGGLPAREPAPATLSREDEERIAKALNAAQSENTRRAYRSQLRRFLEFCQGRGESALPADRGLVAAYLAERAEDGAGIATLRQAAAAIAHVHVVHGKDNPCAAAGVRRVLSGLSRQRGQTARQAAGLTKEDLAAIEASAQRPRQGPRGRREKPERGRRRGDVDIALIRLMRDGLLRRSEAAAACWGDLELAADGKWTLLVRHSKTDQEGRGHSAHVSRRTMAALRAIRPQEAGPGDRIFALSASQISRRIAAAARAAGLDGDYSGHSPRIGMAMDLVRKKQSLVAIQNVGRWRSAVMPAHYARGLLAGQNAVAEFYEDEDGELYEEDGGDAVAGPEDGHGRILRPAFPSAG